MPNIHTHKKYSALLRAAALGAIALNLIPQTAVAAPVLLVNTESFQTIDDGDGTTDLELRFGGSLNEKLIFNVTEGSFQFTDDLSVQGTLSGSALNVDRNATVGGTFTASGAAQFQSTVTANDDITTKATLSGAALRVSGPADVQGALNASGSIRTDGDLTINADETAADSTLTFGSSANTLKYLNTAGKFQFAKSLSVVGNISGSTLTVDGALTLRGVTYNAPTAQGGADTFLKNDGAGNLTWTTTSVGNGSGGIMSMHPEYPNAIYFGSGANYIGQMTASGGTTGLENSYVWTSTRSGIQDYWVSVRVRVPNNFSSWDVVKPIEFRYKTGVASAANNHLTVRMKDTAGADVALTGGGGLSNVAWTTASITGPQAGGTWTPGSYFTVYVKLAANSTAGANAAAGFLNLRFETTTP